jgi:hypothetical protein
VTNATFQGNSRPKIHLHGLVIPIPTKKRVGIYGSTLINAINRSGPNLDIRYANDEADLALPVSPLQAALLCEYGMVGGIVADNVLRYLVARVAKSTIIRVLRMDPARAGEITPSPRPGLHTFSQYIDIRNVKLGIIGGPPRRVFIRQSRFT